MEPLKTGDGSLTLHSQRYAESYRSRHGALSEARHVFLEASGVLERLRDGRPTSVLEVGFGTGLNFLVTAAAAGETPLDYTALENDLPPAAALSALGYERLLPSSRLPAELLAWLESLGRPATVGTHLGRFGVGIRLELVIGDAHGYDSGGRTFDAVYLDPFSPKVNPRLWTGEFLARTFAALRPGGRLVSYSVSGEVRRALARAGADVRKLPGPAGGKREMLVAQAPRDESRA